ncbi:MAG: aquaporin [Candidatus Cybelea sp.]
MARASVPVPTTVQKLAAEFIGTFLVTGAAIGVDVFYYTQGNIDYASRWLARGLMTAAVIYAFSETSGAHVNPAVTIGFMARRVFPAPMAALYIGAQFTGAFAAALIWFVLQGRADLALGASHPGIQFSPATAAGAEAILTFALILVILMTAQEEPSVGKQAALAVGFTVAACGFVAGPISGASMNPARTIAPQIVSGHFEDLWVYVAGPLIGALLAVGTHAVICGRPSLGQQKAARGKRRAPPA